LGAGRETKESTIDFSVGIVLNKKVGEEVLKGDVLAYMHLNDLSKSIECSHKIHDAYHFTKMEVEKRPIIFGKIDENGTNRAPKYLSEE